MASPQYSQGPLSPGTGSNNTSTGTIAWSNPERITAADLVRATTVTNYDIGVTTNYLIGDNFGFSIPLNAIIKGILVEWRKRISANDPRDSRVRIIKAGNIGTTDKADAGTQWLPADSYFSYGGSTDLWGLTWQAAHINAADFGVALSAGAAFDNTTPAIDHVRVTVYYDLPDTGAVL